MMEIGSNKFVDFGLGVAGLGLVVVASAVIAAPGCVTTTLFTRIFTANVPQEFSQSYSGRFLYEAGRVVVFLGTTYSFCLLLGASAEDASLASLGVSFLVTVCVAVVKCVRWLKNPDNRLWLAIQLNAPRGVLVCMNQGATVTQAHLDLIPDVGAEGIINVLLICGAYYRNLWLVNSLFEKIDHANRMAVHVPALVHILEVVIQERDNEAGQDQTNRTEIERIVRERLTTHVQFRQLQMAQLGIDGPDLNPVEADPAPVRSVRGALSPTVAYH